MLVELPNGNWVTPETVHIAVNGGGDVWSVHILRSSGFSTYYANFGTEAEARAHAGELARMLNATPELADVVAARDALAAKVARLTAWATQEELDRLYVHWDRGHRSAGVNEFIARRSAEP